MFEEKLPQKLRPYSGVIYFMVVLVCAHFFWKFTVRGDETDTIVTFFGLNLSAPFNFMATHVATTTAKLLQLFGSEVQLLDSNVLRHTNGVAVRIVWSCTGLKQAYIFVCLIGFYSGNVKQKVWFIPLGLLLVYVINIMRISAITALVESFPAQFELLHEYFFKYLFYAILFGMWVLWEEKIKK
ncbi:MAG: exosortase/archaeosortase family protein [Paludibacter sp.]